MTSVVRALLVDDSRFFATALQQFLDSSDQCSIVGVAVNSASALELGLQVNPDVILLDLNLGSESGLDLIPPLKAQLPHVKIVMLTVMEGQLYRTAALKAGADAFVCKSNVSEELLDVLQQLSAASG